MSIERELLEKVISGDNKGDFFVSYDLYKEIYEFLAQPEEEAVYQKLLRIEKENYVEMLPSELWLDGYETGKRSALLSKQPEQEPEQEPVAWITEWVQRYRHNDAPIIDRAVSFTKGDAPAVPNPNYIPLYLAPPKRKHLTPQQISSGNQSTLNVTREAFKQGVIFAEKAHDITGGGE